MAKFFRSKFALLKRYSRFSNICVYFNINKNIRYGYKFYQKIFRKYKGSQILRINVRKPRLSVRRKTIFGKAIEIKEKFSYLIRGIHSSKLQRYCRLSKSKYISPASVFINKIERRLDIILYRSNIFGSPFEGRSAIISGNVKVNNKIVFNPSFLVSKNDFIDITVPDYSFSQVYSRFSNRIRDGLMFKPEPSYLSISYKLFRIIVTDTASLGDIFYPFNFNISYFFRLYSLQ